MSLGFIPSEASDLSSHRAYEQKDSSARSAPQNANELTFLAIV